VVALLLPSDDASASHESRHRTGYVPAVHEVSAKDLITFPASTSVAVTHPQFAPGDWLVGMQGCVGIGEELCAHLTRQYTG